MSFFKKLGETALNTANVLGAKSAELMTTGKLKMDKIQLEGKIKDKKTAIGGMVYSSFTLNQEPDSEEVTKMCLAIKELEEQIAQIDKEIQENDKNGQQAASKLTCNKCGQSVEVGAKFCQGCGNSL